MTYAGFYNNFKILLLLPKIIKRHDKLKTKIT